MPTHSPVNSASPLHPPELPFDGSCEESSLLILADNPALAQWRDENDACALDWAVRNNSPRLAEALAREGCPMDHEDKFGGTPLVNAFRMVDAVFDEPVLHLECVEVLLRHGANANQLVDHEGTSILMLAIDNRWPEGAKKLVEHGADINAVSSYYGSPLVLAAETQSADLIQFLLTRGAFDWDRALRVCAAMDENDNPDKGECLAALQQHKLQEKTPASSKRRGRISL